MVTSSYMNALVHRKWEHYISLSMHWCRICQADNSCHVIHFVIFSSGTGCFLQERVMINRSLNFLYLDVEFLAEWQWRRCHLKQLFGYHSDRSTFKSFCCTAQPCAFIISDQHIFIVSTLVWHCHVPCQSLNCLEHDTKAHMKVVKISLAICQELHHRTFIHTVFVGSHVKSSGRPACW